MLRHVTAPACAFAQIPNVILRHPRLSSDAKNLLNWQLSLPADDAQCLGETARKAGIKKCAFQNAKRQLLDEGYLHQWRVRKDGGRFATIQLVSNTPLSAKEALAVHDGLRPVPGGARFSERVHRDGPPSAAQPTAGGPTGRAVGRLPEKNTGENTTQPTGPDPEPVPSQQCRAPQAPTSDRTPNRARSVVPTHQPATRNPHPPRMPPRRRCCSPSAGLTPNSPCRHVQRGVRPAPAKWLASGLSELRIRQALTEGLDSARKPLGALHWRLQHALPDVPPPPPHAPAVPAPEPRVARMRECATRHDQPRLFTPPPGSDEKLCRECRTTGEPAPPPPSAGSGFAAFAAARQAQSSRPRPPRRPNSIHRHRRPT